MQSNKHIPLVENKWLKHFAYTNLFISFCAFCLCMQTNYVINTNVTTNQILYALLLFLGTFVVYNLQRCYISFYFSKNTNVRSSYYYKYRFVYLCLIILCLISSLFILFQIGFKSFILLSVLFSVSLFYFLPKTNLRKFTYLKPTVVAAVWTASAVVIPFYLADLKINSSHLQYIIAQFILLIALCIPFDIRDMQYDLEKNTITLPVKFGLAKTKILIYILVLVYALLMCLYLNKTLSILLVIAFSTLCLLAIYKIKPSTPQVYYYFVVDGFIVLQFLIF